MVVIFSLEMGVMLCLDTVVIFSLEMG
jgi:hypothetical protein